MATEIHQSPSCAGAQSLEAAFALSPEPSDFEPDSDFEPESGFLSEPESLGPPSEAAFAFDPDFA
jgi:hypothetical protein